MEQRRPALGSLRGRDSKTQFQVECGACRQNADSDALASGLGDCGKCGVVGERNVFFSAIVRFMAGVPQQQAG